MEIKKLDVKQIEKLNELQKYFYNQLNLFIYKLDEKYFDLVKTFYTIDCAKNKNILQIKITSKDTLWISINIYIEPKEVFIDFDGWHEDIQYDGSFLTEFYEKFKRLLIFALSESCKLIIYKSNDKPYKWSLYAFEENKWKFYSWTGSLIYNFFGKKTKIEKQSHIFKEATYPKELFAEGEKHGQTSKLENS